VGGEQKGCKAARHSRLPYRHGRGSQGYPCRSQLQTRAPSALEEGWRRAGQCTRDGRAGGPKAESFHDESMNHPSALSLQPPAVQMHRIASTPRHTSHTNTPMGNAQQSAATLCFCDPLLYRPHRVSISSTPYGVLSVLSFVLATVLHSPTAQSDSVTTSQITRHLQSTEYCTTRHPRLTTRSCVPPGSCLCQRRGPSRSCCRRGPTSWPSAQLLILPLKTPTFP
jgi:hypothetical protein